MRAIRVREVAPRVLTVLAAAPGLVASRARPRLWVLVLALVLLAIQRGDAQFIVERLSGTTTSSGCIGPCDLKTSFLSTNISSDGSSTPVTSCGVVGASVCTGWTADAWQPNAACPQGAGGNLYNAQDGIYNAGGSVSAGTGSCDEVITAANYSGGDGGRGFRHYRDTGTNQQGGGIRFDALSSITTVVNLRWMIRWSSGFTWGGGFGTGPHYSKDMNVNNSAVGGNFSIAGYEGGSHDFGVDFSGSNNVGSGVDWVTHYGANASDGRWDCVEVQWDITNHGVRMWLNGTNIVNQPSAVDYKSFVSFGTVNTSNQESPTVNGYADYDDVIIERDLPAGTKLGCPGDPAGPDPVAQMQGLFSFNRIVDRIARRF